MPHKLDTRDQDFQAAFATRLEELREAVVEVDQEVKAILANVRVQGDAALIDYTNRFDRFALTPGTIRISSQEIAAAGRQCPQKSLDALAVAAARIEAYHRYLMPEDLDFMDDKGVRLGARWRPIAAVGIYVPGGRAAYPSSVLMNAIPARVAGVERVAMVVPTPDGQLNPLVLAAAERAGISEIYRVGGAQAIGALAFGTAVIKPVDKIVGPGNAYVAAAKRQVYGIVGIDMIAGPSEILVVADRENDPAWIAADLLSQAEHDPAAQSILITDDEAFAGQVMEGVAAQLNLLPRSSIAATSWARHGMVITVRDWDEAVPLIDRIAPEHLELAIDESEEMAKKVRNAGAIFLGRYTPEAVGDYVGGPNHVLPTGRSARFSSGLGVLDFLKRTSILSCDADTLQSIGPAAIELARAEGFEAHARSIAIRLNVPSS